MNFVFAIDAKYYSAMIASDISFPRIKRDNILNADHKIFKKDYV